jgi:hypothetical protein
LSVMARTLTQTNKNVEQEITKKAESLSLLLLNPHRRLCMIDYKPITPISIKQIQCRKRLAIDLI